MITLFHVSLYLIGVVLTYLTLRTVAVFQHNTGKDVFFWSNRNWGSKAFDMDDYAGYGNMGIYVTFFWWTVLWPLVPIIYLIWTIIKAVFYALITIFTTINKTVDSITTGLAKVFALVAEEKKDD